MTRKTVWRAVAEALQAEGVQHLFGLTGNALHLVSDIQRHTDIKLVLVRHEHSGVACAYAYARLSRAPAVCFGNPGPGITNMATGLLEATAGCLPVICITNGVAAATDGKGAFQELDSVALMRPVTKWAVRATLPERVPWLLERAFSIARNGKPGAVFIDIPSDLGLTEANIPAYHLAQPRHRSRADPAAIRDAARALAAARRPLMICGSGAIASGAFKQVAALAEAVGMPVFTTPGGRGILSEDAPLSLGQVGLYFSELGKAYYDRADLLFSLGSRLEEFSTGAWRYFPEGARLIQLDIDANTIGMNWRPDIALVGDAALTLEDLRGALRGIDRAAMRRRMATLERAKARYLRKVTLEGKPRDGQLRTPQILHALNRVFGRDTILVHENGGADLWSYYWPYYRVLDIGDCVPMAEQTAMGMGVIGAIGAKLAKPRKKVVCVTGDGALQMAMMELATAAEQRCGVTWIVLNNRALDWPQYFLTLEGRRDGVTDFAVSPDFARLAEAQGCIGITVQSADQIEPALTAALKSNRRGDPVLIDCHIPKHDYPEQFTRFHREIWGLGAKGKAKAGRVMGGG